MVLINYIVKKARYLDVGMKDNQSSLKNGLLFILVDDS